jgi:hypothetical protein
MRITAATPEQPARLEIGSVKIPLPRYGPHVVLVAALIAGAVYGWTWLEDHHREDTAAGARIAASDLVQLNESARHFGEEPERASPLLTAGDPRGTLGVTLYRSDGCLLVTRHGPNPEAPTVRLFIPQPQLLVHSESHPQASLLEDLAYASDSPPAPPEPPNCIRPWTAHPGQFGWQYGQRFDACRVEVIRAWEDGCAMVETYDGCQQTWTDARWLKCVH